MPDLFADGDPQAVACAVPSYCIAVGYYQSPSGGYLGQAELWRGSGWTLETPPNPPDAATGASAGTFLNGVACSPSSCTAAGFYTNGSGATVPLVEVFNGTSWTNLSAVSPAKASDTYLDAISCPAVKSCTAVGAYKTSPSQNGTLPLAETWNGTSWTVGSAPGPSGAISATLDGVSCFSSSDCMAVGSYLNGSGTYPLAEVSAGTVWTLEPAVTPSGAGNTQFYGVSCASAKSCTAVGEDQVISGGSGTTSTLAESWDGAAWTQRTTPDPGVGNRLFAVSCTSATFCMAVGSYQKSSSGPFLTLGEEWNGTAWADKLPADQPAPASNGLGGVSCTSASFCISAGSYTQTADVTLTETWNGTSWSIQPAPLPRAGAGYGYLLPGVSCHAATTCAAAGGTQTPSSGATLTEALSGTTWTQQATPDPGSSYNALYGISCTSATSCVAVGNYLASSGDYDPLAEAGNPTTNSWSVQSTPVPAGATFTSQLNSVSCPAASSCEAAGWYENSSGTDITLAEKWNGTVWTVQSTPNPAGASANYLQSVWCTTASACTAVGYYTNSSGDTVTLAEAWNGTTWSIQTTPNSAGSPTTQLNGVSCTSASACTAVGSYNASGDTVTLAEIWNGTTWKIHHPPNPAGTGNAQLASVSCQTATACTAVGSYQGNSGNYLTLAETRSGSTWNIQTTPNPSAAPNSSYLTDVSCTAVSVCTAVGYTGATNTSWQAFAEVEN